MANFPTHIVVGTVVAGSLATLTLAADVIAPENLVAVHAGMKVLGLCVVTDLCKPDALEAADIAKIIATANAAEPKLRALVVEYLKRA